MNTALNNTILHVTQKPALEHSSYDELQKVIDDYPYFAPAQLLYAAKLKKDGSYKLQTQMQKTGLYFNNLRWLQYQLMEVGVEKFKSFSQPVEEPQTATIVAEKVTSEPVVDNAVATNISNAAAKDIVAQEETNSIIENITVQPNIFLKNIEIPTVEHVKNIMSGIDEKQEVVEAQKTVEVKEVEKVEESIEVAAINTNSYDEIVAEEKPIIESAVEPIVASEPQEAENFEDATINDSYTAIEEIVEPTSPTIERQNIETHISTTPNDIHAQIAALKANWHKSYIEEKEKYESNTTTQPQVVETTTQQEEKVAAPEQEVTENTEVFIPKEFEIKTEMPNLRTDWDKPKEDFANAPLPFETEPYYTIDYFASQGIKFDYNKEPQDKLTTKMLKFTDWLKKMKSGKPEPAVIDEDPDLEKAIINIAENSNQSKEVVTETMAEVFAKQGKKEKAIQLYIKLSFLIPDKTTYFAAKIKELKGI